MLQRMIVATDVSMTDAGRVLLHPVSFRADPGMTFCVHGPAGCGKSLLAGLLAGGADPASGRISVDGTDITRIRGSLLQTYRQHLGIVTQRPLLARRRSIRDNILAAAALRKRGAGPDIATLLTMLDLERVADAPAMLMSADVQMLTTIARALIGAPAILLFDEPFPLLRPDLRHRVRTLLDEAVQNGSTAFVFTRDASHMHGMTAEMIGLMPNSAPPAPPAPPAVNHIAVQEESADPVPTGMHA